MAYRHFKMHLCDVEPVVEMIYEATAAPARAPFGRTSAISVRMHASEIERRRRLSALSRFTWNTATIGDLNILAREGPRTNNPSDSPTLLAHDHWVAEEDRY